MLAAALEAEVDTYLAELAGERDERSRRLVVRNGHAEPRQVLTGAGPVSAYTFICRLAYGLTCRPG
jgi:hypothetical protein